MGIIRAAKRLITFGIFTYFLMTAAMLAWTFLWPEPDVAALETADVIICLGGGMAPDGTLAPSVLTRVDRCVEIYNAGVAPCIIFSGGPAVPGGPTAGVQMMRYAATKGVNAGDMIDESRAQSTLQNALFHWNTRLTRRISSSSPKRSTSPARGPRSIGSVGKVGNQTTRRSDW